jgi:undecaprenyldiphospho-muramoylpentapeptide beta-N-acetylglucosaminyltransferase
MRFWIVGGGTGGHVYPALAVAQALRAIAPDAAIRWIGTLDGMERELVEREGLPFSGIPAGGLHGVALLNAIRNGWDLARGIFVARRLLRREQPAALLTTGGFVSGPVVMAARMAGVPVMVFVPDIEPARSVKAVIRIAQQVAVTVADSLEYIAGTGASVAVTGYPLGERITRWRESEARVAARGAARAALELDAEARVLLVFGGSRGARSINRALLQNVAALAACADIVHITGTLDWSEVQAAREALPETVRARYRAYPYLHERMGAALAAADLVVSRAGASVLGEFPYFGLPAILAPYPHAWRYQRVNAGWLADRGAAVIVEDGDLADKMAATVTTLLEDDERLSAMAAASRALAHPEAAQDIAHLFLKLGRG